MMIQGKTLWQHAAGDPAHKHVDLCLEWGAILNGPGGKGEWNDGACYGEGRKQTDLRRFCEETEMKNGDIVVLRIGTTEIYGVGVVGQ